MMHNAALDDEPAGVRRKQILFPDVFAGDRFT